MNWVGGGFPADSDVGLELGDDTEGFDKMQGAASQLEPKRRHTQVVEFVNEEGLEAPDFDGLAHEREVHLLRASGIDLLHASEAALPCAARCGRCSIDSRLVAVRSCSKS